ncbi:hypothetical protein ElyMa_000149200 [Elysia marginata]|uniref:Uncharacterized protein n=1 Tax=Elysia marginata TaxID=1093978 RepID=A0AAV4EPY9_9GAST|nr:hypothetical protein ElyMa_000149200 [Elysia marginata]
MIGCAAAVIGNCIIGALYYHPKSPSGKVWLRRVFPGKALDDIDNGFAMGFAIIVNIMMVLLLRFILIDTFGAVNFMDGLKLGVGLWCLTLMLEISHVMFAHRSVDVFVIEQVHSLISMAVSGVCVVTLG